MSSSSDPSPSNDDPSSTTSLQRSVKLQEEALRLNLVGDAVSVAASSVYFCARLLETTANSYVSGPLFRGTTSKDDKENVRKAAIVKLTSILDFKASNELASMAMSLVLPLIFLRFAVSVKDVYQSCVAPRREEEDDVDRGTGRRLLDVLDITVLLSAGFYSFLRIPPLESNLRQGLSQQKQLQWNRAAAQDAFDEMMFAHLLALLQAGLLVVFALVKLSARTERSSQRAVERAVATEQAYASLDAALVRLDAIVSTSKTAKKNTSTSVQLLEGLNDVDDSIVEKPKPVSTTSTTTSSAASVLISRKSSTSEAPAASAPQVAAPASVSLLKPVATPFQERSNGLDGSEILEWAAATAVGLTVFFGVFVNYEHIKQALAL